MKRIHIFSTLPAIAAIAIAVIQACGSGNSDSGRLSHIDSLLGGGLVILENLTNLAAVGCGLFKLCALPLHYEDADGAPVRAVGLWP